MFGLKNDTCVRIEEYKNRIFSKDDSKKELVYVNFSYPVVELKEKSAMFHSAGVFYKNLVENFRFFSEKELVKTAELISAEEGFRPLAGVMKSAVTYEDKRYLSVASDVSIFDGKANNSLRLSQNWEKNTGKLLSFSDVFASQAKEELVKIFVSFGVPAAMNEEDYIKKLKKYFTPKNFFMTSQGYTFFYPSATIAEGKGIKAFAIPFLTLHEKNLLKM